MKEKSANQTIDQLKEKIGDRNYIDEPSITVIEPELRTPTQYAMIGSLKKSLENKKEK